METTLTVWKTERVVETQDWENTSLSQKKRVVTSRGLVNQESSQKEIKTESF